jgi:hypothetical protein
MSNKLLMHYGCNMATGQFMRASHSLFLLELGISLQPLQESYGKYSFLSTHSWMKMLWEKVSKFGVRTVIADTGIAPKGGRPVHYAGILREGLPPGYPLQAESSSDILAGTIPLQYLYGVWP